MQLIVLASGRGSRLKKLTKKIPKCLIKVRKKPIIDYISKNFIKFNQTIILTGYKSGLINKKFPELKKIKNKKYKSTNMVYSLFCAKKYIKQDLIISYSDIIFDHRIITKMIKIKKSHIPLNKNWLTLWKKRMNEKKINDDAEDLLINKNKILSIGNKICDKRPKLQFMGLIKLKYQDFIKLYKFFKKLNDTKIDMTSFLNCALKYKIISLSYFKTSRYWYEIDNVNDKIVAEKYLRK
ncbi:sugar phosphate nucleotidyltransferase [Candidatus Pelagibacter sp. HIMB1709]|uniref:sugar phosphate nucleotidyltransferase n=1 Tax=Candidatus Pelagibacter sp. HIMB1709 TaxID=3413367 RepID=UPI003F85D136